MQQSLTETTSAVEYGSRRRQRPGLMKRGQMVFVIVLVALDIGCTWLAYFGAHLLLARDPNVLIGPFMEFWPLPALNSLLLVGIFFAQRMYQRRRPIGHLDELFKIIVLNTLSVLFLVAILALVAPDFEFHRSLLLGSCGVR